MPTPQAAHSDETTHHDDQRKQVRRTAIKLIAGLDVHGLLRVTQFAAELREEQVG